jgi:predicted ATPase
MKIESLRLRNFKAFQDVRLEDIPGLCVVVGANGSGKTILFDVFGFLKDCLIHTVQSAVQKRGGFKEMVSRDHQEEDILIEVQFRMPIAQVERLVTYHLEISRKGNRVYVKREILRYKRGRHGSPYHFLDFSSGEGFAISNEEDFNKPDEQLTREDHTLDSDDILAIKGPGSVSTVQGSKCLSAAYRELACIRFSNQSCLRQQRYRGLRRTFVGCRP